MDISDFTCFQVSKTDAQDLLHHVETVSLDDLPEGDVVIRVHWSSLNYKDALAAQAHPGVAGPLPHVPGIDAAGVVAASSDSQFHVGDQVLVTGYELGAPAWGGWSEYIRVPAEWIVRLPDGLDLRSTMVIGTAGFTAAQCVRELETNSVTPDSGPVLVTGATGGVGVFAVRLLAQLGYEVHAVSGKASHHQALMDLGVTEVHGREILQDNPKRPLLSATWAGAVDTVGGQLLVALLKSTKVNGCVAACGLVAGAELNTTVYPFILRGTKLAGVTSSLCPRAAREEIWRRLAGPWQLELSDDWVDQVTLRQLPEAVQRILDGKVAGRVVVRVATDTDSQT